MRPPQPCYSSSRPKTLTAASSDQSVRTLSSLSTVSSWDLISPGSPTEASRVSGPRPTAPAENVSRRPEVEVSGAQVGILMSRSECESMRRQAASHGKALGQSATAKLAAMHVVQVQYYRDYFRALPSTKADHAAAQRMWTQAVLPLMSPSAFGTNTPRRFVREVYDIYEDLYKNTSQHSKHWVRCLQTLAQWLAASIKTSLDAQMNTLVSAVSDESTLHAVASSVVSLHKWERAVDFWKAERRGTEILEGSLSTVI